MSNLKFLQKKLERSGKGTRSVFFILLGILLFPAIEGGLLAQSLPLSDRKIVEEYGKKSQDRSLIALINEYRSKTSERTWKADGGKYTFKGRYSHFNLLKNQVTLIGEDGRSRDVAISKLIGEDAELVQRLAEIESLLPIAAFKDASTQLDTMTRRVESLEKNLGTSSQQIEALNRQLTEASKYAPSNRIASVNGIPEVDSKRLETFGSEYVGKQVRFTNAKWWTTDTSWITNLPNVQISTNGLLTRYDAKAADQWVGLKIKDSKGEFFQFGFASKKDWGEFLLSLEEDQLINLVGTVIKLENSQNYGVIFFAIEKVPQAAPLNISGVPENVSGIPEVDSKRLETFGSEYVGKQVRFTNAKWFKISTTLIADLPNIQISTNGLLTRYDAKAADQWVGVLMTDSKGEFFQFGFASKKDWGEFLLSLEEDQLINLVGTVIKINSLQDYGVIFTAIEKVPQAATPGN